MAYLLDSPHPHDLTPTGCYGSHIARFTAWAGCLIKKYIGGYIYFVGNVGRYSYKPYSAWFLSSPRMFFSCGDSPAKTGEHKTATKEKNRAPVIESAQKMPFCGDI